MPTELQHSVPPTPRLPMELLAALDYIVLQTSTPDGGIRGHIVGRALLRDQLQRYGWIEDDSSCLIALDAEPTLLHEALIQLMPAQVITLSAGSLSQPLKRMRRSPALHANHLSATTWRSLGYYRVCSRGVQGFGSLTWAFGERLSLRLGRPELADRCRIGMLRTLLTTRMTSRFGTTQVRTYRRAKP
jgi:hypothetical protein